MVLIVSKVQRGLNLKLLCSLKISTCSSEGNSFHELSDIIYVNDLAMMQLEVKSNVITYKLLVKIKKIENAMTRIVPLNISCGNFDKEFYCWDNWGSTEIAGFAKYDSMSTYKCHKNLNCYGSGLVADWVMQITTPEMPQVSFLNNVMYDDMDFTDFELKTADGTVAFHKIVLSGHSNIFKKMMRGECKEAKSEHSIFIPGVTLETLKDLKDYLYLGTLPADYVRLEPLMIIGARYFIDKLIAHCVPKILKFLDPTNYHDFVKTAMLNDIPELITALVVDVPDDFTSKIPKFKRNENQS